jgi:hypothetical protein
MPDKDIKLIIKAILQDQEYLKKIKKITQEEGIADKKRQGFFSRMRTGYVIVAGVLTGVVAAAFTKVTKLAIDFEEENAKFLTVFRSVQKEAIGMRDTLVNSYGQSTLAATKLLASTGDILTGFGLTDKEALNLSGDVQKLAVDLASFTNAQGGAEAVSQALTKALIGERESLKTYGIAILDADVNQRLFEKGQSKLTGEALRQAKATATLEIAYEQAGKAVGDYERTQDSTANTLRKIKSISDDVQLALGQQFLKAIRPTITEIGNFVQSEEGMRAIGNVVKGIVIGFELLRTGIKNVVDISQIMVESVLAPFKVLKTFITELNEKGIKGIGDAFNAANETSKESTTKIVDNVGQIGESYVNLGQRISEITKQTSAIQIEGADEVNTALIEKNQEKNDKLFEQEALTKEALKELNSLFNESLDLSDQEQLEAKIKRLDEFKEKYKLSQNELTKIDKARAGLQKQLRQKQFVASKTALSDIEGLMSSSNKTLFNIGKAASLATAGINVIEAVTKTMTAVPFPANIPLAIGQAAAGAVQIGKIASTNMQGFAKGGRPPVGSPSIVGEEGAELFVPDRPGAIIPNNQLEALSLSDVISPVSNSIVNNRTTTNTENIDNSQRNITIQSSGNILEDINELERQYGFKVLQS